MNLLLSQPVLYVLYALQRAGYEASVVGGAVRDILLGRPTTDWDFTTNARPEQIMAVFPHHFYTNTFGTVGVPFAGLVEDMIAAGWQVDPQLLHDPAWENQVIDITTYRFEFGYSDNRRPDQVQWGNRLIDDVSRRDFTINALALTIAYEQLQAGIHERMAEIDVTLLDYFGGEADLANHHIRAVGDPALRFQEDALRMMRAIRFGAQLGFTVEQQTLSAIQENAHLIRNISAERIRDELFKLLKSDYPAEGITLLYNAGLLTYILPELISMRGIEQGGHHIYDVWNHSLEALRGCPSTDPLVRFATLLHDIGKPKTVRYQGPRGVTFYGHEVVGARIAQTIGERLKFSKEQLEKLVILVRWHMFMYDPKMTDGAIRRFIKNVGLENINDMMLLRVGDRKGGGSKSTSWRLNELQQRIGEQLYEPMSLKDLAINGNDLLTNLSMQSGPFMGKVLDMLFEEVLDDSSKNNREYLLGRARELQNTTE
jgi:putative nucleotidyltransferase with HDIG domain